MDKFCKKCNITLDADVDFCPECGSRVQDAKEIKITSKNPKFNYKKLLIIAACILFFIVAIIVVFSIVQNIGLKDSANNAKNTITAKAEVEERSSSTGNLACNICAGAYTASDDNNIYISWDDGIYKSKISNKPKLSKDNSKKIADGKYASLNYYDGNIFCINTQDNKVYKISDLENDEKMPYVDVVYSVEQGSSLHSVAINSDNIYILTTNSGKFYLKSTNLRSKNVVNDVWNSEGTKAWMYLDDSILKICLCGNFGWSAFKGDIDGNKTKGLEKYCSGSGNPVSVAFHKDKVYVLNNQANANSANISVCDAGGDRRDINLDCAAQKILLSGDTAFIQCENKHFIWFNTDTNMSHDIDDNNFFDEPAKTINLSNGNFCAVYDDSAVLCDIASFN